ncbi:hypothetical protein AS144_02775 [Francisella endosymbiont of Amblyomma maculatum]|nr:hypothetical protein AS144_02775 [Francisella endosymbiont of Amblyomma maculatum]
MAKSSDQIWIANVTYYPTKGNDRDKSFIILEKVSLLGGSKAILFNSNITGNIAKILGSAYIKVLIMLT